MEEIMFLEQQLGQSIPFSLRQVLYISRKVNMFCALPKTLSFPHPFHEVYASECQWDITKIVEAEKDRRSWAQHIFQDKTNAHDALWHRTLAFMAVGNGDLVAFDLCESLDDPPVVYLRHDRGEQLHGYRLGDNCVDFLNRFMEIGCLGLEYWQLTPFVESPTSGIVHHGQNAIEWRRLIGLPYMVV
jgi:hypothetical protein